MIGFSIDGFQWQHYCKLERLADITSTDISGFNILGEYINDVQGVYHQYKVTVAVPMRDRDAYNALYEILTEPVDGHVFVFPYGSKTIQLTARVNQIPDVYYPTDGDGAYWLAQDFTIISNYPTKRLSLGEVLTRGITPGPDVAEPAVGEIWEWDGTQWTEYSPPSYPDADTMYF